MRIVYVLIIFIFCQCSHSEAQYTEGNYLILKKSIEQRRDSLRKQYESGDTAKKRAVISSAKKFLINTIVDSVFNYWYGTPWEFYGQTKVPKQGTIACGYFVNTVLSDAGFNIPADDWAKLASEVFIKKLCFPIKRFHNRPVSEVIFYMRNMEDGIYIVGLDCHTGFIFKRGKEIKFVHSNYYQAEIGVMAQELDSKNPLRDSKYRVIGKVFNDKAIINWIKGNRIE